MVAHLNYTDTMNSNHNFTCIIIKQNIQREMEKDNINSTKHSHGCLSALRPCPTDYTLLATRYCSVRRLTQTSGDQSEIPKVDTTHDSHL